MSKKHCLRQNELKHSHQSSKASSLASAARGSSRAGRRIQHNASEDVFAIRAQSLVWNGLKLNAFKHSIRRSGCTARSHLRARDEVKG
jgi:hypothetical protein